MKSGSMLKPDGFISPISRRCLAVMLLALLTVAPALAQQAGTISPSLVLVLKLVSTTHVQPVTGIVVSADGQVLVPADFLSAGADPENDEIIVLDGGTDIIRHGRPARIIADRVNDTMALLAVEGLKRPAIVLSDVREDVENRLHLEAFPPAKDIADGADPLWIPVAGLPDGETPLNDVTPLPYVTAAIMDSCGNLAAISLASGMQSLAGDKPTRIIAAGDLRRELESLQIELPIAKCSAVANQVAPNATGEDFSAEANSDGEGPDPTIPQEETVPAEEENATGEGTQTTAYESDSGEPAQPVIEFPPTPQQAEDHAESKLVSWLLVIGFIIAGVVLIRRIRPAEKDTAGVAQSDDVTQSQPASDEPDTVQLEAGGDKATARPRSGQADEQAMPDFKELGEGSNALVMLEGRLDSDTRFKRYCEVDVKRIDISIGRGDADISIEHPTVSRRHACLQYLNGSMTLSDLGSSNGTFIRGVPCLPGEVMFVEKGDEIFLGDVGFHIRLITSEADLP